MSALEVAAYVLVALVLVLVLWALADEAWRRSKRQLLVGSFCKVDEPGQRAYTALVRNIVEQPDGMRLVVVEPLRMGKGGSATLSMLPKQTVSADYVRVL